MHLRATQQNPCQLGCSDPYMPFDNELAFGFNNGKIPRLFSLFAHETVPLISLHSRNLVDTSRRVELHRCEWNGAGRFFHELHQSEDPHSPQALP